MRIGTDFSFLLLLDIESYPDNNTSRQDDLAGVRLSRSPSGQGFILGD